MSDNREGARSALTFRLVGALERYEEQVERLVLDWFDGERYRRAAEELRVIQRLSAPLQGISVAALALLIAHGDLVHTLSRGACADAALQQHSARVVELRQACLRRIPRRRD